MIINSRQDSNAASTPSKSRKPSAYSAANIYRMPQVAVYQNSEFERRREETAWKLRRIMMKTSLVIVMLLLRVMTYVVSYKLFWN